MEGEMLELFEGWFLLVNWIQIYEDVTRGEGIDWSYTYFFELFLYSIIDCSDLVELTSNRLIDGHSCLNAIPAVITRQCIPILFFLETEQNSFRIKSSQNLKESNLWNIWGVFDSLKIHVVNWKFERKFEQPWH